MDTHHHLTLTSVVFESTSENKALIKIFYLTLTSVVFELVMVGHFFDNVII